MELAGEQDESEDAGITAGTYGHRHHKVAAELLDGDVESFFGAMQRPTIDGLNTFLVCKAMSAAGYRVALSGLGGDEAVAGYQHMRYFPLLRVAGVLDRVGISALLSSLPRKAKLSALLHPKGPRDARGFDALFREVMPIDVVNKLVESPVDPDLVDGGTSLRALIEEEISNYLQRTLLPDADAFSMRWSLELRVPFLDIPYFRAAATSARPLMGKSHLAGATRDGRIDALRRRPKRGFSVPMAAWITAGPLREAVVETRRVSAPVWEFVDRKEALRAVDNGRPGRWASTWLFAALNQWLSSYYSDGVA